MNLKYAGTCMVMLLMHFSATCQKIDRKALVQRHNVSVSSFDSLSSLTVGNGAFAFTVDATGLQTFPAMYANGVPLGTQSEWGWHRFPNTENFKFEESLRTYELQGRKISYGVQWNEAGRNRQASDFFRQNPHRLQLGHVGLTITLKNGKPAGPQDIRNIAQTLDLFTGLIHSAFTVEGEPVKVVTAGHNSHDAIGFSVDSKLIAEGRLGISIILPYPTGKWDDNGVNYQYPEKHRSAIEQVESDFFTIRHTLDNDSYCIRVNMSSPVTVKSHAPHRFIITPSKRNSFSGTVLFSPEKMEKQPDFADLEKSSRDGWKKFWESGGAIDFSASTDTRAFELERRIILSQYLTRVQCAGNFPPQETGLTCNSWFGKPHLEMHWWHGVHYALWGRTQLLEKSLDWYFKAMDKAKMLAKRQGFTGARWQKMVDHEGNESPSSVGAFIIWQQPHPITMAELVYRALEKEEVLQKYRDIVFETAEFMASFAGFDSSTGKYRLGPGLIPAQERFKPEDTFNPTYELNYWYWALQTAQQWLERLGNERDARWDAILKDLSPLPVQDGVYLAAESAPDSYTNPKYLTDHPSVLGTVGMLPQTPMTDAGIMKATFEKVWKDWAWDDTWGWDFPMTAMTATRLGMPEKAIEAILMPIRTNRYLVNGHNYQDERLRLYLPGNGGVLIAAALMVGGYEGCTTEMPGIPKDGKWKVKYEGLMKMP